MKLWDWLMGKNSNPDKHHITFFTRDGSIARDTLPIDMGTVRDERRHESFFLDGTDGVRYNRALNLVTQFVVEWSAIPLYPSMPHKFRDEKCKVAKDKETAIACQWADREIDQLPENEQKTKTMEFVKIAFMGTILLISMILILVLFTSGKLHFPHFGG